MKNSISAVWEINAEALKFDVADLSMPRRTTFDGPFPDPWGPRYMLAPVTRCDVLYFLSEFL